MAKDQSIDSLIKAQTKRKKSFGALEAARKAASRKRIAKEKLKKDIKRRQTKRSPSGPFRSNMRGK